MKITEYDASTFQDICSNNKVVVLKFSATWCGPCKRLSKTMNDSKLDICVVECDVDNEPEVAMAHKVSGIPHVAFYKDGVVQSDYVIGADFDKIIGVYNKYNTTATTSSTTTSTTTSTSTTTTTASNLVAANR